MARLFVAVWPPAAVLDSLEALPRPAGPGVRWTTRAQWHVTLRFLGDADPDAVAAALGRLRAPATEAVVGPRVGRLGRHVVMARVHGLDDLAASVRETTAHLGEPPDARPFLGHLTLARLRDGGSCGLSGSALDLSFAVDEIALVASETHPDGARYTDVARIALTSRGRAP